jgi:hypothetical protein
MPTSLSFASDFFQGQGLPIPAVSGFNPVTENPHNIPRQACGSGLRQPRQRGDLEVADGNRESLLWPL